MITFMVLFIVIGIVVGTGVTLTVPKLSLMGKQKPALTGNQENYLVLDLEPDDIFLPREDAPDYIFKGTLLAEKKWQERGYVEEWFQFYKIDDNRYLICFRSKEGDKWKYWKRHPLVLKQSELQEWLYGKRSDAVTNPRAQEETKALIRSACEYDYNLKNILFERLAS